MGQNIELSNCTVANNQLVRMFGFCKKSPGIPTIEK